MSNLINWLEVKIISCEELGGMEKEKWAFIQTLKKVRKEAITVTPCCTEFEAVRLDPEIAKSLNDYCNKQGKKEPTKKRF